MKTFTHNLECMQNLYVDTQYMMNKSLNATIKLLEKIESQLPTVGMQEDELLQSRLAPDMFPFVKQIQVMSDIAKGAMARLWGVDIPAMQDHEESLHDLIQRLKKTAEFVQSAPEEELRKGDERKMILPYFEGKFQSAEDYVRDFAIPNFYFHFATAYAILRMKGYDIGKADFIGGLNLQSL